MIKINFWFKKSGADQGSLEYVSISNPKKILKGKLTGLYACEVCLPETGEKQFFIYADNPIEAVGNASEFTKVYLQGLINCGYTIGEAESHEPWKLEKKDPWVNLEEKVEQMKNNKNISQESKQKMLDILKETFGKLPHTKG